MLQQQQKNKNKKYLKSLLPGTEVFQTHSKNEGVSRDDFAKVRTIHPNVFEKQQLWSHVFAEVKS